MQLAILRDPELYVILFRIDSDLAKGVRSEGCACSGPLHAAHYRRKPRGPVDLDVESSQRHSFCCGRCRKRRSPPSARFLGRHVYCFPVVVLLTALTVGVDTARAATLRDELGVDRRTLARWRSWWSDHFPKTRFWRTNRIRFAAPVDEGHPRELLRHFDDDRGGLIRLLRFLDPLSLSRAI